jgi:hypothetical protein
MRTVKQTEKLFNANNFILIHLKIKQKGGIPVLQLLTFPAGFNNICSKKWFTAFMV